MALDPEYRTKLDTHDQLQIVWDVIGTSVDERQAFLNDLAHSVQVNDNSYMYAGTHSVA